MRGRPSSGATPLQVYLREIDGAPLLSAEQEAELAEGVARGDVAARDRMVRANLRLVVALARRYAGRGLPLEDLVAEGNLGLMRAVEGYEASAGVRFSTYAAYWIKQSMRAAVLKQGRFVRLPAYAVTLLAKWRRAAADLTERLGREPTPEEVGRALRLTPKRTRVAVEALRAAALSPWRDEADPDGDGDVRTLGLAEPHGLAPEEQAEQAETLGRVAERLGRLDDRSAEVVRMRFGLGAEPPLSLREVGDRLGLTRERVRQVQRQALGALATALTEPAEALSA